jgi:dipeptidase E
VRRIPRPLDDVLARWIGIRPLLYLPIAMDPARHPYGECHAWVRSVFEPLGLRDIEMWSNVAGKTDADLSPFGAVYIGGGNTFKLLDDCRRTRFDGALQRFARRGGAIYGGSAAAILLGEDVATCAHMDPNDVGLQDTTGLGLARGHAVWCHYEPNDSERIAAYTRRHAHPVVAVPERAGVIVEGEVMSAAGFEPVAVFRSGTRSIVPPGTAIADAPPAIPAG